MKKKWLSLLLLACLTAVTAVPAYAERSDMTKTGTTVNNMTDTIRRDMRTGVNNMTGNNMDRNDGWDRNNGNNGNFRAAAADNGNDMDWGWLGLIGLAGLAGLFNRDRSRT